MIPFLSPSLPRYEGPKLQVPVVFHVGARKTGTTALQQLLFANRDSLLRDHGILVPTTFSRRNTGASSDQDRAHHQLYHLAMKAVKDPEQTAALDEALAALVTEAESSGCKRVILSTEIFDGASDELIRLVCSRMPKRLLTVVYAVRRVDQYFESLLRQSVKTGFPPRTQKVFTKHPFASLFTWKQYLGGEHLQVLHYNTPNRAEYNQRLLEAVGLADCGLPTDMSEANSSLSRLGWITARARIRRIEANGHSLEDFRERHRFTQKSQALNNTLPAESWSCLSLADRLRCFDAHLDTSKKIAKTFLNEEDAAAFLDRGGIRPSASLDELTLNAAQLEEFLFNIFKELR